MRILLFLLIKEFQQIFRNPAIIRIIFIMPAVQLIVLPLAADYEVKNVYVTVVDLDHSVYSERFIDKLRASEYFQMTGYAESFERAMQDIEEDRSDIIIQIPADFERQLIREDQATMLIAANAVNGAKGGIGAAYAASLIRDFNEEIRLEWIEFPAFNPVPIIDVSVRNWYNPNMEYSLFMVPGILVILLTMVGSFLASINIVYEKEIGTIEQINVSPIRKHQFILGKLIPFWLIGFVVLTIGLFISRLFYGVIPAGSLGLIYLFAAVYLLAFLGIGLLISTYADTQQQAMFISFFLMMIFILMGGLYTSIDSMPEWAQVIARMNPVTYFIEVMRMVIMKGSTFQDISRHFLVISGMAVFFNTWAILHYRKRA
jgi:ABC-2 type transport system permease protein